MHSARYRLAPAPVARLVGGALVVAALLVVAVGVVAALAGWPASLVPLAGAVALAAVLGYAAWLRWGAAAVVLDEAGYRIRFLRDAGPRTGAWHDVREAVAASPGGVACVVLHRRDGRDTVVPVGLVAADRDAFARDVAARLRAAAVADSRRSEGD